MHQLFTTHVYQNKIRFDLKDLKVEVLQTQKADHAGQKWSKLNYRHGYTSYGSWDQMHKMSSTFARLQNKIDIHVEKYIQFLDYDLKKKSLEMQNFWINIMPANTIHTAHIHPLSVISGTFYIDIPKRSSAIRFEDPRLGFLMNAPALKLKTSKQNQRFYSIDPKPGDLILFESWLRHEVPMSKTNQPRISASFNYGWK